MRPDAPTTDVSLIARIASDPTDPEAWSRFVFLYGPHVLGWCRRFGLQDADARDVAQEVLLHLLRRMGEFRYDPSKQFRGWLRVIVHAAWCDWCRRHRPWNQGSGDEAAVSLMREVSAGEELIGLIEEEHERELLGIAMSRLGRRLEPRTMEAFRLLALEGVSGEEAAERLGMKLGSAYAAKAKVQRLLREEVERLDRPRC